MGRPETVQEEKQLKLKSKHSDLIKAIVKENPQKTVTQLIVAVKDFLKLKNVKFNSVTPINTTLIEGVEVHLQGVSYSFTRKLK